MIGKQLDIVVWIPMRNQIHLWEEVPSSYNNWHSIEIDTRFAGKVECNRNMQELG